MNTMRVQYVNGKEFKSFTTEKLSVCFDRLPVEVNGKEFAANEVKLKTVDGGRTSGVESILACSNFEVRLHGVSALRVGDEANFSADSIRITIRHDCLYIEVASNRYEILPGNGVELFA